MRKMDTTRWMALGLLILVIAGCGGGGGGGAAPAPSYTISLTTQAMNFSGPEFTTIAPQAVGVTFSGAGVVVGTLPGQSKPSWLAVDAYNQSSPTQLSIPIRVVTAGLAPGTYSITLRFVTGDSNGNNAAFVDLPITLTLREGFKVTQTGAMPGPLNVAFNGVVSGATVVTPQAGYVLDVRGEGISWSVQPGAPAWIRVTPTSGSAAGTATVTAVTAGLPAGPHTGNIVFRDTTSSRDVTVSVVLNMSYPALSIMPTDTTYDIDNTTDVSGTQGSFVVTDSAQGQNGSSYFNWTADFVSVSTTRTTPYPLIASPTSGSTFGSATTVSLNVDTHVLNGLPSGNYTLPVRILMSPPPPACCTETTFVNAQLTVRMPRLGTAVPYQIPANTATTIRLIGDDLRDEDLSRLRLDGQPLPLSYIATRLSSQEIELAVPAQSAAQHTITFSNPLGLPRSLVEFLVFTPPPDPAGADLPGTGSRVQLVYDEARARLYAVDVGEGQLERYEWNGTSWSDLGALTTPGIASAVKMRDGRRLAVSSTAGVSTLNLNAPSSLTLLTDAAFMRCGFGSPNEIAVGEYGSIFMTVAGNSCSPYGHVMEYDLLNDSHDDPHGATYYGGPGLLYLGLVAASGDGRYIAMGDIYTSGMDYALLDLRTRTYVSPRTQNRSGRRMHLDAAGTKVLLHAFPDTVIRDRAGAIQGNLPANAGARISPDGTRALIHVHGANGTGYLQVYDVSGFVGQGTTFPPVGAPVPVPFDMGTLDPSIPNFGLEWSADSKIAFVSGSTRIVAIRLP